MLRKKEKLKKPSNDMFHYIHFPQNIRGVIKPRKMRWLVHGGRMGEKRNTYTIFVWNLKGEDRLGNLGVYVRMTLKRIWKKEDGMVFFVPMAFEF